MAKTFSVDEFEKLFRKTLTKAGVTGSVIRLSLTAIKPKTLLVISHATVENKTNSFTKVRLGIDARGLIHYLDEYQSVAAGELVVSRSDIILGEGDILFSELTGTTDSDELILTCIGWELGL